MEPEQVHLNIPVAHFGNVLTWEQATIDRLVKTAVEVAQNVGLRLDDDAEGVYLKEAEGRSARIDSDARAVMFSESDIAETIAVMRKTRPVPTPLRERATTAGREERFLVGNGGNLLFDWEAWQPRPPVASDLVDACHWAQGCDDVAELFPPFLLKDLDQRLGSIYSYALTCRHCRKKVYHEQPTESIHVKYLDEMAHAVEKRRGYFQPMQNMEYINPPFRLASRAIRTMLARVDTGACDVMGIGPMTVGGMTAPVTIAGSAVVALAEILCGLAFFRILRPGFGLQATVCTGSLDLRTAGVSYFGMRTHLQNLAIWELLARGLGVDCNLLTFYREANEPGMQALYEFGTAQAFFSSTVKRCRPEIGGLACGNMFSPEQAVLDMELVKEFNELLDGFEVSEEALALEQILNARFEQDVHISSGHTIRHMKSGVPFSGFLFRSLPAGARHDKNHTQTEELLDKAHEAVVAARRRGEEAKPDDELGDELYEYVKKAAAGLSVEAPELL